MPFFIGITNFNDSQRFFIRIVGNLLINLCHLALENTRSCFKFFYNILSHSNCTSLLIFFSLSYLGCHPQGRHLNEIDGVDLIHLHRLPIATGKDRTKSKTNPNETDVKLDTISSQNTPRLIMVLIESITKLTFGKLRDVLGLIDNQ